MNGIVPESLTLTPATLALTRAFRVGVLAERVLQVHTEDARASLDRVPVWQRRQYEDAAAVALALLEPEAQHPARYVAAHKLVDLGSQSPLQRRGLVQMVTEITARYLETLAGHHPRTVAQLAPLVARDQATVDELPEGVL